MEGVTQQSGGKDFRIYLQEIFLDRLKHNPRYSLRAYARSLGLNSGTLSGILSGKRPLTHKAKVKLVGRLGLGPEETIAFMVPQLPARRTSDFETLSLDTFRFIADWYHYAILELTHIRGFKGDASTSIH